MNTVKNFTAIHLWFKLDQCAGICNTLKGLSNKVHVPNKIKDLNLSVFKMITGINESKTLMKHMSCECKSKFDGTKCDSKQWWNKDKFWCECKKHNTCANNSIWNPATWNCENGKYLASIMDDSLVICDEVIESSDEEINLKKRMQSVKKKRISMFYLLFY